MYYNFPNLSESIIVILKYNRIGLLFYFQEKSNQFLSYRSTVATINSQNPIDQNCRNIQKNLHVESKPQYPTRHETREEFL